MLILYIDWCSNVWLVKQITHKDIVNLSMSTMCILTMSTMCIIQTMNNDEERVKEIGRR